MTHDDTTPQAGAPARSPAERIVHGVTLVDEFAWLRAENWREVMREPSRLPAEIAAYLNAENAAAEAFLAPTAALRAELFAEMRGRIKEDDSSVPAPDGPFAYATRYRDGGQHPILYRTPREGGPETVLLDGDAMAEGHGYFQFGGWRHSDDHRRLAYATDTAGSEYYIARIRDTETGKDLPDLVENTSGQLVFSAAGDGFWYTRVDENHRPLSVHYHVIGTDPAEDRLVYAEPDSGFFVGIGETLSRAFAVIQVHDHDTAEALLLDRHDPEAAPRLVRRREAGVRYSVDHHPADGGTLFILTNVDGAEDFKIVRASLAEPAAWTDLVPHKQGRLILSAEALEGWLVRLEREEGLPRIVCRSLDDGAEHAIAFAEEAYSLGLDTGYEFATTTIRFVYSSMTTPSEVYDYDVTSRARRLLKRQEVPSGHDPASYVTRRIFAAAPDGESVPISLLYRADIKLDGTAPCLVYGYGAYGHAIPAAFSTGRLSLVDRGMVYAIAHIRGGTEKGWRWYTDGKLAKKPNTFGDFIAATRHLAAAGLVDARRIVAHGGSAGGMLMGAIANRAPELYAGIIAEVPFVDVLNTMLDDTLPLTPPEWPEWGNPITDPEAFAAIRAYSPYDNVVPQAYPAILAIAGLTDPRVTYWEPAKWVARLKAATTGTAPILLKTNMGAGHGGASGRFDRLHEVALAYAFALLITGAAKPA